MLQILLLLQTIFSTAYINSLLSTYGYLGLFGMMALEGASLPIPSEVIVPIAGYLAAKGVFNFYIAALAILAGNMVGVVIDYVIGYFIGKDVVYKHLHLFHINKEKIDAFDSWFNRNGGFAVFVSRMIPVLRGLISFPAGFARMPFKKFFLYSLVGSAIWDILLMLFGYYLLSSNNLYIAMSAVAFLALILYIIYRIAVKKTRK
jgi:membrane protein DedA with SNARE-associated domain